MDVVCLGILVADVFAEPIDALPASGELKLTNRFLLSVGGCAANTAVCLHRLGRTTKILGKVGRDLFGDFVVRDLERLGIETAAVQRSPTHPTSATMILNVRGQDRRYIHCFGANADFSLADLDWGALDGARVLYVGGALAMPKLRLPDLEQLFAAAKDRSMLTVLDIVVPAGTAIPWQEFQPILALTDAFLPNYDEARCLTGQTDPVVQAEFLAAANPLGTVVITQGRHGVLAKRDNQVLQAKAFKVNTIDESGAGDAFAAGFIVGLLEAWSLDQTLSFASAVGASCTRALGCTAGVFSYDEAIAFIAEHPLEIQRRRA